MCAWGSNRLDAITEKDSSHEELLSILQTASNRLEYLTPNDWTLIADRAKRTPFHKGDVLIQQRKQTKAVYLVHRRAKVESSKAIIAHIGPGQVRGEMAILENGAASATVTAEDDGEACAIEWKALSDLFELFPHLGSRFYRSLAVNMSRRLREQIAAKTILRGIRKRPETTLELNCPPKVPRLKLVAIKNIRRDGPARAGFL